MTGLVHMDDVIYKMSNEDFFAIYDKLGPAYFHKDYETLRECYRACPFRFTFLHPKRDVSPNYRTIFLGLDACFPNFNEIIEMKTHTGIPLKFLAHSLMMAAYYEYVDSGVYIYEDIDHEKFATGRIYKP